MKKILLLTLFTAVSVPLSAQTLVLSQNVTKGMIYKKFTTTGPNVVHVLQVDLSDPSIKIQSAKSSNVVGGALQTVKQIAAGKDVNENYHNVIGAINGDFFSLTSGNPVNIMVPDGQILTSKYLPIPKSIFGISDTNDPFISLTSELYRVNKAGVYRNIDSINRNRGTNNLILYNQYKGATTGTNTFGTELRIGLAAGAKWQVNGTINCTVLEKKLLQVGMAIPAGQAVLSGNGTSKTYLDGFNVGDALTLDLQVSTGVSNTNQVMGGFPRILTDGQNTANTSVISEGGTLSQATDLNPHTGVGISQNENTMFMVVVDGRTAESVGMSLGSLADFFTFLGAYNAVNLDGGGSSTLVANNTVKNVPSDGVERSVSSALVVWSAAQLFDDFEANEGHFTKLPTDGGSVGIATTSTMDRVTTTAYSGIASERAILNDNTASSSNWVVRLMSGDGVPANNTPISSTGTMGVWFKTSTAQTGAKIYLRFDDTDGTEETPGLTIVNDGAWHQYNFDLNYTSGGTGIAGGNGLLGPTVTFESIILKQNNTASQWTVYFDEIAHFKDGSGTGILMASNRSEPILTSQISGIETNQDIGTTTEKTKQQPILYPNPNEGYFILDFKDQEPQNYRIEIVSIRTGKIVYETTVNITDPGHTINVQQLSEGLYSVNLKGDKGCTKSLKMIIKKQY